MHRSLWKLPQKGSGENRDQLILSQIPFAQNAPAKLLLVSVSVWRLLTRLLADPRRYHPKCTLHQYLCRLHSAKSLLLWQPPFCFAERPLSLGVSRDHLSRDRGGSNRLYP